MSFKVRGTQNLVSLLSWPISCSHFVSHFHIKLNNNEHLQIFCILVTTSKGLKMYNSAFLVIILKGTIMVQYNFELVFENFWLSKYCKMKIVSIQKWKNIILEHLVPKLWINKLINCLLAYSMCWKIYCQLTFTFQYNTHYYKRFMHWLITKCQIFLKLHNLTYITRVFFNLYSVEHQLFHDKSKGVPW